MTDAVSRQTQLVRETGARGRTTIFLHIGKTAGTTLAAVLRQRYPSRTVFTYDSHDPQPASDQLARLNPTQLRQLRLVRGHLLFGIHAQLPQPALYIGLLRDPFARLESAYRHILVKRTHRLHAYVTSRRMTFAEFVTSGVTLETDNWQTRCIAGDVDTPFGRCDRTVLERAKANIDRHFALVGLSEMFDESVAVLTRMYGWRGPCYVPINRGSAATGTSGVEVAPQLVESQIVWDRELYAYASSLLHAVIAGGDCFDDDLAALRRRNAFYYPIGRTLDRLWEPVRDVKEARLLKRGARGAATWPDPLDR